MSDPWEAQRRWVDRPQDIHPVYTHHDRYRTAMTCMARFMAWVGCEAYASEWRQSLDSQIDGARGYALLSAIERGMFRLEWGQ